jgi:hypothetical protein
MLRDPPEVMQQRPQLLVLPAVVHRHRRRRLEQAVEVDLGEGREFTVEGFQDQELDLTIYSKHSLGLW